MSTTLRICGLSTLLTAILALTIASRAHAQAAGSDSEQERTRLYQEAQELGTKGDWKSASQRLERVVAIRSAPKALIALAYAELQQGHVLRARSLYEKARDDARAANLDDDVAAAEDGIRQVEPLIGRVVLQLPADVTAVEVTVDGASATRKGATIQVDPGRHELVVTAEGRDSFRTTLTMPQGGELGIPVTFAASRATAAPAPTPADDPPVDTGPADGTAAAGSSFPVGPVVLGGAGAIVTTVGIVFWLGGNSEYNAIVDDECGGNASGCPIAKQSELVKKSDDARGDILLGQIGVGVGVAALAGAGAWWLVTRESGAADSTVHAGLGVDARGARLTLAGRF